MKIKIKSEVEAEIEITFPSYWKIEEHYTKPKYYAFFSEEIGLFVTEGFTYQTTPLSPDWKKMKSCPKEEVEAVFVLNQKMFNSTMFPVDATDIHLTPDEMTKTQLVNEILSQGNG